MMNKIFKIILRGIVLLVIAFIIAIILFYFFDSDTYTEEYLKVHNLERADLADDYGYAIGAIANALADFIIFFLISLILSFVSLWRYFWRKNEIFKKSDSD